MNNAHSIHRISFRNTLASLALLLLSLTLLSCNKTGADSDNTTGNNPGATNPVSGTPGGANPTTPVLNLAQVPLESLKLQKPQTCMDYKKYVLASIIKRHAKLPRYCSRVILAPRRGGGTLAEPATAPTTAAAPPKSVPDDVSNTNNQVAGVNESDIVKADDRGNLYIASGRTVVIADGFPPQNMTTLKELTFDGRVTDLFLDKVNLRLIVVARFDTPSIYAPQIKTSFVPAPVQGSTDIVFIDVSDPAAPITLKQTRLPGNFQAGRRIKDRLHLIFQNPDNFNALLDKQFWSLKNTYRTTAEKLICASETPDAVAANLDVIAAKEALINYTSTLFEPIIIEDSLPVAIDIAADKTETTTPLLSCGDIQHPTVNASLNMQVISSVDTNGANLASTAMINNAWRTYVSLNNIYVSETNYNWWWDAPNNVTPTSQTAIYKFAISAQKPTYLATGTVEGITKDQFSFSEFNGDLRIATNQSDWVESIDPKNGNTIRSRKITNNVFVMRDNAAGNLEIIGSQRGFGKDETIRSVRFLGTRGFVVTFRSIDPLFSFDLTVPEAPKLMGELSIPGFSSYMQPYDENHLVTIGRAPGANGVGTGSGIQLQLFDVTDLANPKKIQSTIPVVPGKWSWSSAEYDHKAFTFYKPKGQQPILAIPLQYYDSKGGNNFSGIFAYNVSITNGFTLIGKVDHADLSFQYYCTNNKAKPEPIKGNPATPSDIYGCNNNRYTRLASPRRSVIMSVVADTTTTPATKQQLYLYSVSDVGLKANDLLNTLNPVNNILFPQQAYPWWPIQPISAGPVLRL